MKLKGTIGMKKFFALMICACIMFANLTAFAANEVTVNYNGEKMVFDANPFIESDRMLVPMRAIFEAVGAEVSWQADTRTVVAALSTNEKTSFILLQIGTDVAFISSLDKTNATATAVNTKKTLDAPAKIVNDRTFVPLRFVMEELGCDVKWNPDTYTVDIINK